MEIKMLIGLSGKDFSLSPGETTSRFPDKEAKGLVRAGYAAPVDGKPREKAVKKPAQEKRG